MRSSLLLALLTLCSAPVIAQVTSVDSSLSESRDRSKHSIVFPLSLLIPEGIRQGYAMRDFIASREFGRFDSTIQPEQVFDEIYYSAETYAHGNLANSLLAAAFGVIEHETIPIAFFGSTLNVPLTSENHARFVLRWSHLPEHIYHTPEGDRDKLQHFFASAWLKEILGMDWLAKLAGNLVELGEHLLLVGGVEDPRDLHANADGIHFAVHADGHLNHPPSADLTPNP